jgi:hypothetical protein
VVAAEASKNIISRSAVLKNGSHYLPFYLLVLAIPIPRATRAVRLRPPERLLGFTLRVAS